MCVYARARACVYVCVCVEVRRPEHNQLASSGSGWRKDVVNQCLEFGVSLNCHAAGCLLLLLQLT